MLNLLHHRPLRLLFLATLQAAVLAGCGGGGSGDATAPASDCFNPTLYRPGASYSATYDATAFGTQRETIEGRVLPSTTFNGKPALEIRETTSRADGAVIVQTNYESSEGFDILRAGMTYASTQAGGTSTFTFTRNYEQMVRDRMFALEPGGSQTVTYNATVTEASGPTRTQSFTIATRYLGQEPLVVKGENYVTCKFEIKDSRLFNFPGHTWYIKSWDKGGAVRGFIARSESRDVVDLRREFISGSQTPP